MRFKAWTIVLTLLAGTVVVSWEQAPRAAACSCVLRTPAEYAETADLVATGTVVTAEIPANPTSSADDATYTIDLTGVWKGDAASTITLRAALSSASCGIEGIREGMVLTVFATKDGGDWRTNICDGTGPDAEQTAIAALGEPSPIPHSPAANPSPTSPRPSENPRGNEKGVNEGSRGPTAPPEPGADVQEPGGQGRGSMAIPLLIIATAGLIAAVTARLRE